MSKYIIQKDTLIDIVSAIREVENSTDEIKISEIANRIRNLNNKTIPFVIMVGTTVTDATPKPFLAKEDMTWEEWCDNIEFNSLHSSLAKTNTEDIISTSTSSVIYNKFGESAGSITYKNNAITPKDKIVANGVYYCILNTGLV